MPDDVPVVQADQNRIIQVLYNLLHNSVKYTDEGEITVDARVENDKVVVTISDTGVGRTRRLSNKSLIPIIKEGTHVTNRKDLGLD